MTDVSDEAERMLTVLRIAGLDQGVILSGAYGVTHGEGAFNAPGVAASVRTINRFVADQVARHPSQLIGFLSVNPLHPSALAELDHWNVAGGLRGVKLHLSNADVDFADPAQLTTLREFFARCARYDFALIIHLRSRERFTVDDVENFIAQLPERSLRIQFAHWAGWGSIDPPTFDSLETFARHITVNDPRTRLAQFDMSGGVNANTSPEQAARLVELMRRIGIDRFLFASDFYPRSQLRPERRWSILTQQLPLTNAEFVALRHNRAYYLDTPRTPGQ